MKAITLEELLEAGCHFGHQVGRQNPKARDYVFEARDGVHIIDLALTKEGLEKAAEYIKQVASEDGTLLIVGSKRQAVPVLTEKLQTLRSALQEKGVSDNLYTVTARWIGGTLTNSEQMIKNYKRLEDLTEKLQDEVVKARYTKKELGLMEKQRGKLNTFYSGLLGMTTKPTAIFVIDTHFEELAVKEAKKMGVPVVGIVDTNADPDPVDYVIPANDDAAGSLELLIGYILDAWQEGRTGVEAKKAAKSKKEAAVEEEIKEEEKTEEKKAEKPAKKTTTKKAKKEDK